MAPLPESKALRAIVEVLQTAPVESSGHLETAALDLTWSGEGIEARRLPEAETRDTAVTLPVWWGEGELAALQLSRSVSEAPLSVLDRLLGRHPKRLDELNVELRGSRGPRLRMRAVAPAQRLLGLPLLQSSGERVELSSLLALVDAARWLGATVAAWGDEEVLDAPESSRRTFALGDGGLRVSGVTVAVALGSVLIAGLTGWLKALPFAAGFGCVLLAFLVRECIRTRGVHIDGPGPFRSVRRARLLQLWSRHQKLGEFSALEVLRSPDSRKLFAMRLLHQQPRDSVVVQTATPYSESWTLTDAAPVFPPAVGELQRFTGLPVRVHTPKALPTAVHPSTIIAFLLGGLLLGGWLTTLRSHPHEARVLGGWFSGHGSLGSAITGTFTEDYSLVFNPIRVSQVAIDASGRRALTVGDGELCGWDDASTCHELSDEAGDIAWLGFSWKGANGFAVLADGTTQVIAPNWKLTTVAFPAGAEVFRDRVQEPVGRFAWCAPSDAELLQASVSLPKPLGVRSLPGTVGAQSEPALAIEELAVTNLLGGSEPRRWSVESGQHVMFSPECDSVMVLGEKVQTLVQLGGAGSAREFRLTELMVAWNRERWRLAALGPHGESLALALGDDVVFLDVGDTEARPTRVVGAFDPSLKETYQQALMRFLPDGRLVLTSAANPEKNASPGVITVLSPSGEKVRLDGHDDEIMSLSVASGGAHLITGSRDQTARVWELP